MTSYPKENELISVILPVYNVANYMSYSIETLLNQSYKNLEIILVDDGSTDESGNICDEIQNKDSRVTVIHTKNQGVSAARNAGMDYVHGEYLTFMDPDDIMGKYHIENLYNAAKKTDANFVITGYTKITVNSTKPIENKKPKSTVILDPSQALTSVMDFQSVYQEQPWGKLYKKNLFSFLHFPVGKFYEDRFVTYKVIFNAKKIAYEDACDYYYLTNRSESTMNQGGEKILFSLEASREILNFTKEKMPKAIWAAERRYYGELIGQFSYFSLINKKHLADLLFKEIRKVRKEAISSKNIYNSTKAAYILSYLGKHLFQTICKIIQNQAEAEYSKTTS